MDLKGYKLVFEDDFNGTEIDILEAFRTPEGYPGVNMGRGRFRGLRA